MTYTEYRIQPKKAVAVGVSNGISDIAKYITIGVAAVIIYKLVPKKHIKKLQQEARRFQ